MIIIDKYRKNGTIPNTDINSIEFNTPDIIAKYLIMVRNSRKLIFVFLVLDRI